MPYKTAIAEKRTAASEAIRIRQEILERWKDKPDEAISGEDKGKYDKAKADSEKLLLEVQDLEGRQAEYDKTAALYRDFKEPATQLPRSAPAEVEAEKRFKKIHKETFHTYLRHGYRAAHEHMSSFGLGPKEQHALITSQNELGGFLVPDDFRAQVLADLPAFTVFRDLVTTVPTARNRITVPTIQSATGGNASIYTSGYTGSWRAEGYLTGGTAPTVQNQPTFGQENIDVRWWQPDAIEISPALLDDSAAPLDSVLSRLIAETFGLDLDSAIHNGLGVVNPKGILQETLTTVNSGDASLLTYDGLIDLYTGLPAQYHPNARFVMNMSTYGAILKLEDTAGNHVVAPWQTPGMIWGRPIVFSEFMADVASSAIPVLYGDLSHYWLADRQELRVQRLEERYAPNIGLLPSVRVGGKLTRTDPIRTQTVST